MEGWYYVMCLWLARLLMVFVYGLMFLGFIYVMTRLGPA